MIRWAEESPLKSKKKEEIGKFIFNKIFLRHGPPKELISDQGTEFLNDIVGDLCIRMKTNYSSVSDYNPNCNGAIERFNRTFIAKIARTVKADLYNWSNYINVTLYSYNISCVKILNASPFKLLYGRDPYDFSMEEIRGT